MRLKKQIPARTESVTFSSMRADFMNYGSFKEARQRMGLSLPNGGKCGWCNRPFVDTDMMAIGIPTRGRNLLLCQQCFAEGKTP